MTAKISKWLYKYRWHFFLWPIYLCFEGILIGLASNIIGKPLGYLLHGLLNIGLFYSNIYLVLARGIVGDRQNLFKLASLFLIQISLYVVFKIGVDLYLLNYDVNISQLLDSLTIKNIASAVFRGIQYAWFSIFYFLYTRLKQKSEENDKHKEQEFEQRLDNQKLKISLEEAKNAYLKSQINPHFLFNMLNFIQENLKKSDKILSNAVMDLAELMRFAIKSEKSDSEEILAGEIEQTEILIKLYKIRFSNRIFVDFEYSTSSKLVRFIPLVLMTLTENLFKHGNLRHEDDPGKIRITFEKGILIISTYNRIGTGINKCSLHKGLANISQRMVLKFGTNAIFQYGMVDENHFQTRIEVGGLN